MLPVQHKVNYIFKDPIIKLGHVFGIVPYYDFKRHNLIHRNLFKLHGSLLVLVVTIVTIVPYYFSQQQDIHATSHLELLQLFVVVTTILLFVVTVLGSSYWNAKSWEQILDLFSYSDCHVMHSGRYFLSTPFLSLISGVPGHALFAFGLYLIGGIYSEFSMIFYATRHVAICLMLTIIGLVKKKYLVINDTLQAINQSVVIKSGTVKRIQRAEKMYVEAGRIVEYFNQIFGWPLLLLLAESVENVLLSLAILTEHGLRLPGGTALTHQSITLNICFTVVILSGPVQLIFICDDVVQEARKLMKQCYKLYDSLPLLAREKEELEKLTDVIQNEGPKFTAANFFEIGRSTLLSIISTTTTYMIVVLQFNYL